MDVIVIKVVRIRMVDRTVIKVVRIQMVDVTITAEMVPRGMDTWASLKSPE